MEITQENVEKLNVGDHPGARLCKGLLLDAIEAGDKLEEENESLKKYVSELESKTADYIEMQKRINELKNQIAHASEISWIPVDVIKPEWGKLVEVLIDDGSTDTVRFSHDYKWVSKGMATGEASQVTHWRPTK